MTISRLRDFYELLIHWDLSHSDHEHLPHAARDKTLKWSKYLRLRKRLHQAGMLIIAEHDVKVFTVDHLIPGGYNVRIERPRNHGFY